MHAIKDEFEAYGWRRMQAALRHRGWIVNHEKIKRLMREHAMHPPRRRRFVATTGSDHDEPVFPNRSRDKAISRLGLPPFEISSRLQPPCRSGTAVPPQPKRGRLRAD